MIFARDVLLFMLFVGVGWFVVWPLFKRYDDLEP